MSKQGTVAFEQEFPENIRAWGVGSSGQTWPGPVGKLVWSQTEIPSVSCCIWPTQGDIPLRSYFQLLKDPTLG